MIATASPAAEMLQALLGRLEALDFEGVGALLDADAVFDFPFKASGQTSVGREAIVERLRTGMGQWLASIQFTVQAVHLCQDPELVIAEYASVGERCAGGAYGNRYVGLLRVRAGRIVLFREYFNPLARAGGA